jgi:hypothetical protein
MSCAKKLKQVLADSALAANVPLGRFRSQYDADEFFESVLLPTDTALVAAAKALCHFCTEDDRFNDCMFALKAILAFLEEETSDSPTDETALAASLRELKTVMSGNCSVNSLVKWAERWYRL